MPEYQDHPGLPERQLSDCERALSVLRAEITELKSDYSFEDAWKEAVADGRSLVQVVDMLRSQLALKERELQRLIQVEAEQAGRITRLTDELAAMEAAASVT